MATKNLFPVNFYFYFFRVLCPLLHRLAGGFWRSSAVHFLPPCLIRNETHDGTDCPGTAADRQRWSSDLSTWQDIGTPPVPRVWFRSTRREEEEEEELLTWTASCDGASAVWDSTDGLAERIEAKCRLHGTQAAWEPSLLEDSAECGKGASASWEHSLVCLQGHWIIRDNFIGNV